MSSVAAQHIPDKEAFLERRVAGSFRIGAVDTDGELSFWYCCPCGCGAVAPLLAGNGFKPADGPSWTWNGSVEDPTLHPSVNHIGHWHGWLRNGQHGSIDGGRGHGSGPMRCGRAEAPPG